MNARILVGLALPALAFGQVHAAIEEIVVTAPQTRDRVSTPSLVLDNEALQNHLRLTVVNQVAIDQPRYSGLKRALDG